MALKDKSKKLKGFTRTEELLRRSEEYVRSILQTSNDAFVSIDSRGIITEWNRQAEVTFGWKREEAVGRTLKETLIPPRYREAHERGLARFLKTGEGPVLNKTIELSALRRDGSEFPVELTLWPTKMGDQFYFHAFIRDVTERKKTEAALQKAYGELEERVKERTRELGLSTEELIRSNADLQQFAYVASHDLQEPLRMVSMYVDLISEHLKDKPDPQLREYLQFAQSGAIRAQQLINELLEYSRIGMRKANFVATSLEEILRHVLSLLAVSLNENQAVVTFDPLPTLPVDRFQMEQLFQNFISNAVKYRAKEPPRIHVTAKKQDGEWVIGFRDNGIGIDPKYKEMIFVIFKRLHTTAKYPGTGIGLAFCKKIVENHQGRIWVDSKLGEGATFYFTLPEIRN